MDAMRTFTALSEGFESGPIDVPNELLLEGAAAAGWYGVMSRSLGPQVLGGEAAAATFIELANDRGGSDNITVVVVEVDE